MVSRGVQTRTIFDQPQHAPLRLANEVALVLAVQSGLLDPIPLPAATAFRQGLRERLDSEVPDVVQQIPDTGALDEAGEQTLHGVLRRYVEVR